MQAKGAQGLCYFSDEKYSPGHKCNLPKHMFVMELEDCMAEELTPVIYSSIIEPAEDTNMTTVEGETPMISYCALAGIKGAQTIQVMGYSGKKLVQILLNSGSTLNFIDMESVKRLGCTVVPTPISYVNLGNNSKEVTSGVIKKFGWMLHCKTYYSDLIVFPIGRYDIVLGVLWMNTLGPVTMDFNELIMSFTHQGKQHALKGVHEECKLASSKAISKLSGDEVELFLLHILPSHGGAMVEVQNCSLHISSEEVLLLRLLNYLTSIT